MKKPPEFPLKFLRWFCKPWYVESIEGDLFELFDLDSSSNPKAAKRKLFFNTIRFFKWRYLKDLEDVRPQNSFGMLKTFFKVTFRNLKKSKLQTFLNVFGLSLGIGCCLLMLMHVSYQRQFDQHIPDLDQIYRVTLNDRGSFTPSRLVKQLKADYPEVITGSRVSGPITGVLTIGARYFTEDGGLSVDSTFFEIFPNEFISGDPENSLNGPKDMVLTKSLAAKLFPDMDPLGQMVEVMGYKLTVKAIVKDPTPTTTVPYTYLASIPWEKWATQGWWTGNNFFSYIKIHPDASIQKLSAMMPDFVEKYIGPEMLQYYTQYETFDDYLKEHNHLFTFVPLADIHLNHPHLTLGNPGSLQSSVVFSLIAFLILLLASINYVNMTTARSSLRSKEIGMRKVMGSIREQIAFQFLIESFTITFIALLVGVGLAIISLPFFNSVSEMNYTISSLLNLSSLAWFVGLTLLTALLSGSYPAIFLSSISPISALRGSLSMSGSSRVRSYLVVFQFAISLFLMVATYIVYEQLGKMSERNLGLDAEHVYVLGSTEKIDKNLIAFKNELMSFSGVSSVGVANSYPSSFMADWNYSTLGEDQIKISPYNIFASPEIINVWGLNLLEGRFFRDDMASDTSSIVVNSTLVKELGWQENPIGQMLTRGEGVNYRVIGVVEDFVTGSARSKGRSLLFRYADIHREDYFGNSILMIKIKGDLFASLEHIEKTWDSFMDGYPMDGIFMDDSFERLYQTERRFGLLFTGFSVLALMIACIGLFSLASFILEIKRKEIAIRKVMGAHISNVFIQISNYFGKLIGFGVLIALPLVFYIGNGWLEDYVERIDLGVTIFLFPSLVLIIISLLTISFQIYQSASNNPVEALKEE